MSEAIQQGLMSVAAKIERQIDEEVEKLDNMNIDDIQSLREKRLKDLKAKAQQKREWLANGHGVYEELSDEKDFFEIAKKSKNIVCHFYRDATERCRIVDKHLKILAPKHVEAKFCKINAEKCPFLTQRLRIKVIPTIALINDSHTKDYIVGFTDLGNRDDFSTDVMEWRIAKSGAIEYNGDLLTPPNQIRKKTEHIKKKTIRSTRYSDDSDEE